MTIESVIGARISVPPEAIVPLLVISIALAILIFAGSSLARWKETNPVAARKFGMTVGAICMLGALFFLVRSLPNQSDPNNDGTGQLQLLDAPIAGFLAAIGAAFWRMGDQRKVALAIGLVVGGLMFAKPFVWPVLRTWTDSYDHGGARTYARGMLDPEHLGFLAAGLVVFVTGLVAGLKAPPAPKRPGHAFPNHPDHVA